MLTLLPWIAIIGSIIGHIGVIKKKLWGMQIWTFGTVIWIVYAILTHNTAQLIMFCFYECLNTFLVQLDICSDLRYLLRCNRQFLLLLLNLLIWMVSKY